MGEEWEVSTEERWRDEQFARTVWHFPTRNFTLLEGLKVLPVTITDKVLPGLLLLFYC